MPASAVKASVQSCQSIEGLTNSSATPLQQLQAELIKQCFVVMEIASY